MSQQMQYKCDCCGQTTYKQMHTVKFGSDGEEVVNDLCDKCFSMMRGWIYSHDKPKDATQLGYTISQNPHNQNLIKFFVQNDYVTGQEHLCLTEYGIQELLLQLFERE